jgi:hypothetical protein
LKASFPVVDAQEKIPVDGDFFLVDRETSVDCYCSISP